MRLRAGEYFGFLGWRNEPATDLEQVDSAALLPRWGDLSTHGGLGSPGQQIGFVTPTDLYVQGPGTFLVGTQTLRLNGLGDGQAMEIAFDIETLLVMDDPNGDSFVLVASDNADELSELYSFHLGAGSPGYDDTLGHFDERDPLIVNPIPEPSSMLLLGLGLATGMVTLRRRLKR